MKCFLKNFVGPCTLFFPVDYSILYPSGVLFFLTCVNLRYFSNILLVCKVMSVYSMSKTNI